MASIQASSVQTRIFRLGEDLASFVVEHLPREKFRERSIVCVTSKIVSLAESAIVPRQNVPSKAELVRAECDEWIANCRYGTALTIKHGILIPAAGIDESNAKDGCYILFPKDPYASARELYLHLKSHYGLKELGVIITDSHTHPLRRGVTGIGLSHYGFKATRNLVGKNDLFGRPLAMTHVNVLDAVSVAAVYVMGESNESSPLAVVEADGVEFTEKSDASEIRIPPQEDLYSSFYKK